MGRGVLALEEISAGEAVACYHGVYRRDSRASRHEWAAAATFGNSSLYGWQLSHPLLPEAAAATRGEVLGGALKWL